MNSAVRSFVRCMLANKRYRYLPPKLSYMGQKPDKIWCCIVAINNIFQDNIAKLIFALMGIITHEDHTLNTVKNTVKYFIAILNAGYYDV